MEEQEHCRLCDADLSSRRDIRWCGVCGAQGCWQCVQAPTGVARCQDCEIRAMFEEDGEDAWGV